MTEKEEMRTDNRIGQMDDRGQEKNKIGKVGSLTRVLQIGKCTG